MTSPNRAPNPGGMQQYLIDPQWVMLDAVVKTFADGSAILPFASPTPGRRAFFIHSQNEPDKFVFAEKTSDPDELPLLYSVVVDGSRFSLNIKRGLKDEDWQSGIVDSESGQRHMDAQDELGLSEPNDEDFENFRKILNSLVEGLLASGEKADD